MRKIDPIFVSALYYGINKAVVDIVGTGGQVLGRESAKEMISFLKEEGILKENMTDREIRDLFVNLFGLAEDLKIEDREEEVVFQVIKPVLTPFLERVMKERITPYVCPFMYLLSEIYSQNRGYKLMFKNTVPGKEDVKLIFKKIKLS